MDKPTCATCPFWEDLDEFDDENVLGFCHFFPPVMLPRESQVTELGRLMPDQLSGYFPVTDDDDWCGQHPAMATWLKDQPHA